MKVIIILCVITSSVFAHPLRSLGRTLYGKGYETLDSSRVLRNLPSKNSVVENLVGNVDSSHFFKNLSDPQRAEALEEMKEDTKKYVESLLNYLKDEF